ncbi:MAG: RNA-directed DNA polymerase [Rhizobiales bacterium]|nr:RNA-directed DNA polymerase [Hyphomicrobiales bacterium]
MDKRDLASNIAISLTNGTWSKDQVTAQLMRRFPKSLHRFSNQLSAELLAACPTIYAPSANAVQNVLQMSAIFERIFRYCQRRNIWPNPVLVEPIMAPTATFSELEIPQLPTVEALADWLLVPIDRIDYLADPIGRHENHEVAAVNHYHYLLHPKKSGGLRLIEAPKHALKSIQRQILRGILDKVPTHDDAFGFVRGRCCVGAAARHAGEQVVVNFDLKDFFPSVGTGRVFGLFRCLGYPNTVAGLLTGLCTTRTPHRLLKRLNPADRAQYRERHLPQGAPTSPALANHVAFALDRRLAGLARSIGANYSRYADDLSFSGDLQISATLLGIVPQIVHEEGLSLNPHKTHIMSAGSRQLVTNIVVNRHVNVTREKFDKIKATIHACAKPDDERLSDPVFRAKLLGQIGWVETVNPKRGLKLRKRAIEAIRKATIRSPSRNTSTQI